MLLPSIQIITLLALSLLLLKRVSTSGIKQLRTTADAGILLLLLSLTVSFLLTPGNKETNTQVTRLLTGISIFYWVAGTWKSQEYVDLAFKLTAGAGIVLGLIAIFSVAWPIEKTGTVPDSLYKLLQSNVLDKIHPNVMAGTLVLIFPLILAKVLFHTPDQGPASAQYMYIITAGFVLSVLLLTKSRGAYIALLSSTAVISILRWISIRNNHRKIVLAISFIGMLVFFLIVSLFDSAISSGGIDFRLRIEIWSRALAMINDFPLTGAGMGGYGLLVDKYYPFFSNQANSIPHAHNLYLQIAADLGLPALVAWGAILLNATVASLQIYRSRSTMGTINALGAGLICSQVALISHGFVDSVTWGMVRPAPLVWVIWGLAVAGQNFLHQTHHGDRIRTR